MPIITNTYTPADLLGWAEFSNTLTWSNAGFHTVTTPGGNGTLKVEGEGTIEEDSATDTFTVITNATGNVEYRGELDISDIPADAIISQIVIRLAGISSGEAQTACQGNSTVGSGNCTITANTNAGNSASMTFSNPNFSPFCSVGHLETDNDFDSGNSNVGGAPVAASAAGASDDSDDITFLEPEFVNLGLTLAQFIAQEYNIISAVGAAGGNINASVSFIGGGTHVGKTGTASGAVDSSVEITSWEYDITFETEDTDVPLVEETFEDPSGYEFGGIHGSETPPTDIVIIVDISGIYVLVPNKRDDSWYDREGAAGATIDVKIPDPFVSLAFLPEDE